MSILDNKTTVRVGLLGASFDTGNLGVNALAESSIKCILHRWPDATVHLLASGRTCKQYTLEIDNQTIQVENLPIRFCKNIFMRNHFTVLFATAILLKIVRFRKAREFFARRNPYLRRILEIDLVADITGGDSFSDIYGVRRFFQGAFTKYLWMLFGKNFIFLPQTYGPFNRRWVRWMARGLLRRASQVYSRDQQGYESVSKLLSGKKKKLKHVKVVPDVAFVLDPAEVQDALSEAVQRYKQQNKVVVGLNVSGLLYNGGYSGDNMFELEVDYVKLMESILSSFLADDNVVIMLVPHVCPKHGYEIESDPIACNKIYERLESSDQERVLVAGEHYDHKEVKYIVGQCDFFMGARMHSCIAAMSQHVPTVGLAYSDKFAGVFETVGQSGQVVDLRGMDQSGIIDQVSKAYAKKDIIRKQLLEAIDRVQRRILSSIFDR
jgi:polysaccharide pyruvyl transferase WcaK-like protein